MIKIKDIVSYLEGIAPPMAAEAWDTGIGLVSGNLDNVVTSVLVALDLDEYTFEQCLKERPSLLILHHPPLFQAVQHLRDGKGLSGRLASLIRADIAVYVLHTNFDASRQGTAQGLAFELGIATFEPQATPLLPNASVVGFGCGWIFDFQSSWSASEIKQLVLNKIGGNCGMRLFCRDANQQHKAITIFPGSFDREWIKPVVDSTKVTAILTGEISWDAILELFEAGIAVIVLGHDYSEWSGMRYLARSLSQEFAQISINAASQMTYNIEAE